jgi:hypothetical protein
MGVVMKVIEKDELHQRGVTVLGLDPDACDLYFEEAIAAALRRAAGFLCPCSYRTLIQAVMEPLEHLSEDQGQLLESIENALDAMIAYGDLLEEFQVAAVERQQRNSLLYAAPPSFVSRKSGSILLLGIVPDHCSPLPEHLEQRVQYISHVRCLFPEAKEDLRADLKHIGLIELSMDVWNKASPPSELSSSYIQKFDNALKGNPGTLVNLEILNSAKPVHYYRGRWEPVIHQTGRFVARRPQAYGNNLWCYVELRNGIPEKLVDLPLLNSRLRGCDEAWRLQFAIDAVRNQPQRFKVRTSNDQGSRIVDFYSPVPAWAQKRWDAIGEPVSSSGCLFSYKFPISELQEEINFMQERLWLAQDR